MKTLHFLITKEQWTLNLVGSVLSDSGFQITRKLYITCYHGDAPHGAFLAFPTATDQCCTGGHIRFVLFLFIQMTVLWFILMFTLRNKTTNYQTTSNRVVLVITCLDPIGSSVLCVSIVDGGLWLTVGYWDRRPELWVKTRLILRDKKTRS